MIAAQRNELESVEALLKHSPNAQKSVNVTTAKVGRSTSKFLNDAFFGFEVAPVAEPGLASALHLACEFLNMDVAKKLIEAKADVDDDLAAAATATDQPRRLHVVLPAAPLA